MPKDAFIRARTESSLKNNTQAILKRLGLSMTDAINLFLVQVQEHDGLPFDVKIPNAETIQAMKDSHNPEVLKSYKNFSELRKDIGV